LKETDPEQNKIQEQVTLLKKGTNHVKLMRAATSNDGIFKFSSAKKSQLIRLFEQKQSQLDIVKFVPASGAATRMFKAILEWIESPQLNQEAIDRFFAKAEEYPFFNDWMACANDTDTETFHTGLAAKVKWLKLLTGAEGLNYSNLPKGLIPFHDYGDLVSTPVAEHLKEAIAYGQGIDQIKIHFTVSEDHQAGFEEEVKKNIQSPLFEGHKWRIEYSHQSAATNTVFIDSAGQLVKEHGVALTRPGGHGALIHNLNSIDADIVFIKNIDNVCHGRLGSITNQNKKLLAGTLLKLKEDLRVVQHQLLKGMIDESTLEKIREKWGIRLPKKSHQLRAYLQRPIRVCGMVKNEGEPGGGPFWCHDETFGESLQIVEQAQIDQTILSQKQILEKATHFNPVDIVCSLKDFDGKKIDLEKHIDSSQYFVSNKNYGNTPIRVLEWPGLWNGAMAHWITVFVEVPPATFNPVKQVTDLLKTNHLA